jgi:1-acyl-sn-glycerol-3-phosphate acyltransferase
MLLLRLLYTVYAYAGGVCVLALFMIFSFFLTHKHNARSEPYFKLCRFFCRLFYGVLLLRVQIKGAEHLHTGGGAVYIANHQSWVDIPLLYLIIPGPFSYIFKKELLKIPWFGWHIKHHDHLSIDRQFPDEMLALEKKICAFLAAGKHVAIYPEGTRSPDGKLQSFKRGSFRLALLSGAPIVPIYIQDSARYKRKHERTARPVKIHVTVGPPIAVPACDAAAPDLRQRSIDLTQQVEDVMRQMETRAQKVDPKRL